MIAAAGQFVLAYREAPGKTRGELAELLADLLAEGPTQLVHQGFSKLLEDRCGFEIASEFPPEQIREAVFRLSAKSRQAGEPFDRSVILQAAAEELKLLPEQVDVGLFADLKDEQRVLKFDDCTPEYLVRRYNVALAQALLVRSTGMEVRVTGETPARFRQLFRAVKFHKLICTIKPVPNGYSLYLDGPLSLFSATQKYGLQLALFLPTLLHCKAFTLNATLRWGAQRKEKTFELSSADGLASHTPDFGVYQPKELAILAENFKKMIDDWSISDDPSPLPVGDEVWVPDFQLTQKKKVVYVEVLGFWRKVDLDRHLAKLPTICPAGSCWLWANRIGQTRVGNWTPPRKSTGTSGPPPLRNWPNMPRRIVLEATGVTMFIFEKAPFPSCHASTVVEASPGKLVAAWFGGKDEGAKDVQIWLARFDGAKWSAPEVAGTAPGYPCWNPVLFRPKDGPLHLWYKAGPSPSTWSGYVRRFDDKTEKWSPPETLPAGFYGPVRAKPIQLKDGTIHAGTSVESGAGITKVWTPYVDRSTDGGKSWTRSTPFNVPGKLMQIQPTLYVKDDGTVVALVRSGNPFKICQSESKDGGKTFSPAEPTELLNPNAGIDVVKTAKGDLFLIYNPSPPPFRTPLSLARSADDGKTWKKVVDLEAELGEYSYPAIIESSKGMLEITYTWRRTHIKHETVDPGKYRV